MTAAERLDEVVGRFAAPTDGQWVRNLTAALRAVLVVHTPRRPTSAWDLVSWESCSCGAMASFTAPDGMTSFGPVAYKDCPTIRAIDAVLDVTP